MYRFLIIAFLSILNPTVGFGSDHSKVVFLVLFILCVASWLHSTRRVFRVVLFVAFLFCLFDPHYENTPIQIDRKFHLQKLKIFRQKTLIFFQFLLKT